jgi:hypothetical protein
MWPEHVNKGKEEKYYMETIDRHMKIEYPAKLTIKNKGKTATTKTENQTKQDIPTIKMQPYISA